MSSKTKIVVLKARELIYTGIFILLGILLILLLIFMFVPSINQRKQKKLPVTHKVSIFSIKTWRKRIRTFGHGKGRQSKIDFFKTFK